MSDFATFMKDIVRVAGREVRSSFGTGNVAYTKHSSSDIVTHTDLRSNSIITEAIKKTFPGHGIVSEETGEHNVMAEYVWILDPLDGSTNFLRNTPLFGIALALVYRGSVTRGVIYDPIAEELYYAEIGEGATVNGKKIQVTTPAELNHTFGCFPSKISTRNTHLFQKLVEAEAGSDLWFSVFSSAAVSATYVVSGKRDWYISLSSKVWDHAAESILLLEAGCTVTDMRGEPWQLDHTSLVAASPHIHKELIKIIRE